MLFACAQSQAIHEVLDRRAHFIRGSIVSSLVDLGILPSSILHSPRAMHERLKEGVLEKRACGRTLGRVVGECFRHQVFVERNGLCGSWRACLVLIWVWWASARGNILSYWTCTCACFGFSSPCTYTKLCVDTPAREHSMQYNRTHSHLPYLRTKAEIRHLNFTLVFQEPFYTRETRTHRHTAEVVLLLEFFEFSPQSFYLHNDAHACMDRYAEGNISVSIQCEFTYVNVDMSVCSV